MIRNRAVLFLLAIVFATAGCVDSASESAAGPDDPRAIFSVDPDEGGMIRGLVTSDELFPVVGVDVLVDGTPLTTTDDAGAFEVGPLAPATYNITVDAAGYEPAGVSVEVVVGQVVETTITMRGIPGQAPYVRTIIHDGFNVCSIVLVYSAGPFPSGVCPFGTPKGGPKVEVGEEWAAGVQELAWRTSEEMALASSVGTEDLSHGRRRASCVNSGTARDWCPALIWGPSPLRIFVRPNDAEYAKKHAIDGKETWPGGENFTSWLFASYTGYLRKEINSTLFPVCEFVNSQPQVNFPKGWGCPFGIGYSLGIKLTYYHTTFYLQPPSGRLEDFTALPDN